MKEQNFIAATLGCKHLAGAKYLEYILIEFPDGIYKNKDVAEQFDVNIRTVERNMRYYISQVLSINSQQFLTDVLKFNYLQKITVKNFVKHICNIINEFDEYDIYQINDDLWVASVLSEEGTFDWYCEEYAIDKCDKEFYTLNLINKDKEGMWNSYLNQNDKSRIGELYSIHYNKDNLSNGDLQWHYGDIYKFMSYREAIRHYNPKSEYCFEIASTNY